MPGPPSLGREGDRARKTETGGEGWSMSSGPVSVFPRSSLSSCPSRHRSARRRNDVIHRAQLEPLNDITGASSSASSSDRSNDDAGGQVVIDRRAALSRTRRHAIPPVPVDVTLPMSLGFLG